MDGGGVTGREKTGISAGVPAAVQHNPKWNKAWKEKICKYVKIFIQNSKIQC